MRNLTKLLAGTALAIGGFVGGAMAQTNLTISTWLPPANAINTKMLQDLADRLEEVSEGEVTAEIKHGLAPPNAQMDLIMDGAADISIIFHGYQPGRFVGTKLAELPGYEGSSEAAAAAYWRVHEAYLADLNEHRGVKLIALSTHGPGQIHTIEPVKSLEELEGLKIRLGGGVSGDVGSALGVKGINVPGPKIYETLASNAADGVAIAIESRLGFKLTEVADYVYEMPGGFYRGSFAIIMSEETFNDLPEDIQAAFEEEIFGEPFSRRMGARWDEADEIGRELTLSTEGNEIFVASEEDQQTFEKISQDVIDKVLSELSDAGVDAEAAHEMVQAEMTKIEEE